MSVVCFSHPKYRGVESPVLACKTCCTLYVEKIKGDNAINNAGGLSQDVETDNKVDITSKSKYVPRQAVRPVFTAELKR